MAENIGEHRRGFFTAAINGLMGIITAAIGIPAAGYLLIPPRTKGSGGWVEAGDLTKLTVNQPEQLVYIRSRRDGWKTIVEKSSAWVVKTGDQQAIAFSPVCTHLGCAVSWNSSDKTFACPCHTSSFSPEGKVLGGPAPRALDRIDVKVEGGKLLLGDVQKPAEA